MGPTDANVAEILPGRGREGRHRAIASSDEFPYISTSPPLSLYPLQRNQTPKTKGRADQLIKRGF